MTILVILVFALPVIFIGNILVKETYSTYLMISQKIELSKLSTENNELAKLVPEKLRDIIFSRKSMGYFDSGAANIANSIISTSSGILFSLPSLLLNIFFYFFVVFFAFRDGERIFIDTVELIPIKDEYKASIVIQLMGTLKAVIYGSILTAVIQGALGALGFYIFGLKTPILWGLAMALFTFIPFIGTAIVWFPASLYLLYDGLWNTATPFSLKGVFFFIYCFIFVASIDNILKPKLIGDKAKIHPLLIFLGVFGGLMTLGLIGVFVGPILVGILISFIEIYRKEKKIFLKD